MTEERIAALEERMAAMQATIDELRAKVQAREPIGRPIADNGPTVADWDQRMRDKIKQAQEAEIERQRQRDSQINDMLKKATKDMVQPPPFEWLDNRKEAQLDLFPSHKPQEPRHTPRQFLDIEKRQEAWARGYVDPNRPDQATSVLPSGVRIMGVSASIDGKQLSTAETRNLIDRLWGNAQATQAQADRDGENLKK